MPQTNQIRYRHGGYAPPILSIGQKYSQPFFIIEPCCLTFHSHMILDRQGLVYGDKAYGNLVTITSQGINIAPNK